MIFLFIFLFYVLPLLLSYGFYSMAAHGVQWWQARQDATGLAPDPATTPEAVVQVYSARAFNWRGIFGVHTWVAVKPGGASAYTRYEVFGWGVRHGREAVRIGRGRNPDGYWFGSMPEVLVDLRGAGVDAVIDKIHAAALRYPHNDQYRIWPGPNSNTFTAFIGREVPELRLELPPTAIGKDYLPDGGVVARSPSGTGVQLSLSGVLGILAGLEEGVEVNLLGLTAGVDVLRPALKLPGLGRLGVNNGSARPRPAAAPATP